MSPISRFHRVAFCATLLAVGTAGIAPLRSADTTRGFLLPSLYHVGYWVRDVAKSRAFYHDYLGFDEPYDLNFSNGALQLAVMKVNERQVLYLFPNAAKILPNGDNLDHLGLETDNLAAFRAYVLSRGLKVGEVHRGHIGDLLLGIWDPDGRPFEVTQFAPEGQLLQHRGKSLPPGRISSHLRSAAITVADMAASLHFYRDLLGFVVVEPSGKDGSTRVRVPDGTDMVILSPYSRGSGPAPRAVPEYALAVPDLDQAARVLADRAQSLGIAPPSAPTVSEFGERQISCVDPDGTRVVLTQ